jgi:prevent-host-death family protein
MQSIAIFEAKAKLSELVKAGHAVEITVHRKPVARLYPVFDENAEFLSALKRQCELSQKTEDDGLEALQD